MPSSSTPVVSVIMPVSHCNPIFFENSMQSVFEQTLRDLELIVVVDEQDNDNKSLLAVLNKFAGEKRLRIIMNKDSGFVEALNAGVVASRGKYVARMDSDDLCLPDRLRLQVNCLETFNLDFVGGWAYVIDEHGKIIGTLMPPTDAKQIRKTIMVHNPFLHSAVLFKKSILSRSGVYNSCLFGAEDYDLWLRFISLGFVCVNLPSFVIKLRETSNSVLRGGRWQRTRASYARAKSLALTRLGYNDPLSLALCFVTPFTLILSPNVVLSLKSRLGWLKRG